MGRTSATRALLTTATSTSCVTSESPDPAPMRPTRNEVGRRASSWVTHCCCSSTVGTSTTTCSRHRSSSRAAATPIIVLPVPVTASITPLPPCCPQVFRASACQGYNRSELEGGVPGATATPREGRCSGGEEAGHHRGGDPLSQRNRPWPANKAKDTGPTGAPRRLASSTAVIPWPSARTRAMSSASKAQSCSSRPSRSTSVLRSTSRPPTLISGW